MADIENVFINDKTKSKLHARVRVCAAFKNETVSDFVGKAINITIRSAGQSACPETTDNHNTGRPIAG